MWSPPGLRSGIRAEGVLLLCLFISFGLTIYQLANEKDAALEQSIAHEKFLHQALLKGAGSGVLMESEISKRSKTILLPAGFDIPEEAIRFHLKDTISKDWPIDQLPLENVTELIQQEDDHFSLHEPFPLFNTTADSEFCEDLLQTVDTLKINERKTLSANFTRILEIMVEEHDVYKDPYFTHIRKILITHLRAELSVNLVTPFWYRFSGSSVWLKDYGVHLVLSRFVFSELGIRTDPRASFVLAQLFDEQWNEVQDVRLVFPTNTLEDDDAPTFRSKGQDFFSHRFPRILPIPFVWSERQRAAGSEDPRVMLVRNKKGYDEPVVFFNSHHEATVHKDGQDDKKETFRSMFMAFPFQLQKGKAHLTTENDKDSEKLYFTTIHELRVEKEDRARTSKNWAPFVSQVDRDLLGNYDTHLYFITNPESMKVIKCALDSGLCSNVFINGKGVGPLRGGTPFVNINSLLREQTNIPLHHLLPPGREVLFSVARAHLTDCGCGDLGFYRPNLMVVIKDEASFPVTKDDQRMIATKYVFKAAYVSSFLSLHVPVDPWFFDKPYDSCEGTNAIIPNGIGSWSINSLEEQDGKWVADDNMLLGFSVSDFSVDRMDMKGLLNVILNLDDVFYPPRSAPEEKLRIVLPRFKEDGNLAEKLPGMLKKNIKCAMESSMDFCAAFGAELESLLSEEAPHKKPIKSKKPFEKQLKVFDEEFKAQKEKEKERNKHIDGLDEEEQF